MDHLKEMHKYGALRVKPLKPRMTAKERKMMKDAGKRVGSPEKSSSRSPYNLFNTFVAKMTGSEEKNK